MARGAFLLRLKQKTHTHTQEQRQQQNTEQQKQPKCKIEPYNIRAPALLHIRIWNIEHRKISSCKLRAAGCEPHQTSNAQYSCSVCC
jgi:hypothetical protein